MKAITIKNHTDEYGEWIRILINSHYDPEEDDITSFELETAYKVIDGRVAVNAIYQIIHDVTDMGYKLI